MVKQNIHVIKKTQAELCWRIGIPDLAGRGSARQGGPNLQD